MPTVAGDACYDVTLNRFNGTTGVSEVRDASVNPPTVRYTVKGDGTVVLTERLKRSTTVEFQVTTASPARLLTLLYGGGSGTEKLNFVPESGAVSVETDVATDEIRFMGAKVAVATSSSSGTIASFQSDSGTERLKVAWDANNTRATIEAASLKVKSTGDLLLHFGAAGTVTRDLEVLHTDALGDEWLCTRVTEDGVWTFYSGSSTGAPAGSDARARLHPKDATHSDTTLDLGMDSEQRSRGVLLLRADKVGGRPAVIVFYDVANQPHYLFWDTGGRLRVHLSDPGSDDTLGRRIGGNP
jgi:hypothetical protein